MSRLKVIILELSCKLDHDPGPVNRCRYMYMYMYMCTLLHSAKESTCNKHDTLIDKKLCNFFRFVARQQFIYGALGIVAT